MNAVVNCSFLQSSHIQVAIYDNRLEITSPGGLMPGVTIERMKEYGLPEPEFVDMEIALRYK